MTPEDSITVLRARWRRLAKTIDADGGVDPYDKVKTVDLIARPIADLSALELLLRQLEIAAHSSSAAWKQYGASSSRDPRS